MSALLTQKEIKNAKQLISNLPVAKTFHFNNKSQTRRLVKDFPLSVSWGSVGIETENIIKFAKHKVGDILWVREPAKVLSVYGRTMNIKYLADNQKVSLTIPPRFYNAWAGCSVIEYSKWISLCQGIPNGCIKELARIFLRVTKARVERLQNISEEDILKEGIVKNFMGLYVVGDIRCSTPIEAFKMLWDSTAPQGYKWEDNPWVFAYDFERVEV